MSLNYIEDYADAALHSLDPNIKFQAEACFKEILQSLIIQEYPRILENYSQKVAFVFLLLLNKQVAKSPEIIEIFKELQNIAFKWHLPSGQFKRPTDSSYLPYHIVNTLGNTIGICMNQIYVGQKTKNELVAFLKNQTNQLFKLFLYNHFVEAIYMMNDHMDFVNYKRIVESFQEKMIPIILQELYPYFISVTDKIKINELSSMLPTLSQKSVVHKFDLFKPEDKVVSQLVFNLLKEIVSFKYNITSSQYDFHADSEYFLITFPEGVLSVLSSKQFLEAFYFMLQKMVSMDYNETNLDTSFQCLKKILLSKFSNLKKEQKVQLIHLHYVGLFRLINSKISSERTLEKIMDSISKFVHNFGLVELQKNQGNHIDFSTAIKQKAIMIVRGTELSSENRLFSMTSEVICKIAKESVDMSQQKYIVHYKNLCRDFYVSFFESYITKDFTIMGKSNVYKISGLAQILEDFFKSVNCIGSMDMGFMFRLLISKCSEVFMSQNPKKIANFIFLVTSMVEENFFDRNVIYETTPNNQLQILGTLIRHCFEFMDFYKKSTLKDKMIDVAILLFLQKIMNQCLSNLGNNEETIMISSKTYEVINMSNRISMTDEQFLMFCFDELQQTLNTQDYEKVEYVLEALYMDLLKLKHTLRRESFVETIISKNILQKTIELSRSSLQESLELLKERRKLYKIITILSFDDLLDSYRSNIDYVVEQFNQDFREGKYAKIIFDMSGICENIETSVIYRYFLNRINGSIGLENLIKTLYEHFGKDGSMLEEVVYLNYTLLCDKSLRMSERQLSFFIYDIIDFSLPFVSQVLDFVRNSQWSDLLNEVLKLANLILEATYINLFLIKRKSKDKLIAFLYKIIDSVLVNYEWAHQYPQLSQTIHDTIQLILTNASEAILTWIWTLETKSQQNEFMNKFIQLIQFTMNLCIHSLESASTLGKKYYLSEKILETISKIFSFMRYKRNSLHRQNMIQTIESIIIENQNHSAKFLQGLYKISMTNIKNMTKAFNAICICIMELTYFYPKAHYNIFLSLGISAEIVQKNERIFKTIQSGKEDSMFVSNLKGWLCKNEDHYDVDINDY